MKNITKLLFVILFVTLLHGAYAATTGATEMSAWTVTSTETTDGQTWLDASCTLTTTTADTTIITLPLLEKFNWYAPISVYLNEDAATIATGTTPVILYIGISDDFDLSATEAGVATVTDGISRGTIEASIEGSAAEVILYSGIYKTTDVTDLKYFISPCVGLAFSITAGTAMAAETTTIRVRQLIYNNYPSTSWQPGN